MGVEEWLAGERREVKSLLMKIGVAVSLSFAGYLFYRLSLQGDCGARRHPRYGRPSSSGARVEGGRETRGSPRDKILFQREDASPNVSNGGAATRISFDVVELSRSRKNSEEDGASYLLPQFHELVFGGLDTEAMETDICENPPAKISPENGEETAREQEIVFLKDLVQSLQERERSLEDQLLEYYGLKEQESVMLELQDRLNIGAMEAELLSIRIDSLQADNQRLQEELSDYMATKAELESARANINHLKRKFESDSAKAKETVAALQERIAALRDLERKGEDEYQEMERRLERLNDLEREVAELREMNSKLEKENVYLSEKLRSTQISRPSAPEIPQASEESEEAIHLRQTNDELAKEIEQLHTDRCADVEELVYLRWINACLRYELRNYQTPPGKTVARDLSKTLSPKSEHKVKQLINEYANPGSMEKSPANLVDFEWECCSSSQASSQTENGEPDDASLDASAATKASGSGKTKFLSKLKRLVLGKDTGGHRHLSVERSPRSCSNSARRATTPASWFDEMTGRDSCDSSTSRTEKFDENHYDHHQENDSAWTRNLPRVSLDFQRLRGHDDQAEAAGTRCKSDVGASWRTRMASCEAAFLRSPHDSRIDEEEKLLAQGRSVHAPETPL
ncbi:unnamed protein product [Spirodela intermedia]|uniref:Uncharacterized protein n=1 Tax=Spirodela intermedia TaxID=51605 RepID=A0A7I8IUV1_SPIIN|nr:unnamed protein product [Spirodela intermedia]CAA6660915.1 unnamed protein product [Spirodela intermedia]